MPRELPTFRTDYTREKRTPFALCVFVINEGENVRRQLREMKAVAPQVDVIVADGGSTDGSLSLELMEKCGVKALLVKTGPGKLSAQMRMALSYALDEGYEGIVTIDGNGKDGISAIPTFLKLFEQGCDHIQGSRYLPGGHHENTPLSRQIGVNILHAPLISLAAGLRYTDTTNGFRGYSRNLLLDPRIQPFREVFFAYELHYYLAIRAARLGFRCVETPVSRVYPARGPAPTKISPIKGNLLVLKTLMKAVTGQFNPPATSESDS